ncbi:MAG: B12-binding domain-containing radical SAM protein [Anaerolineae bacterium]|nr:B12-binding domain-containing radical SAM protein [Anaerolineae bacterium]
MTMEPLALAYVAAVTPPHWSVQILDEANPQRGRGDIHKIAADYRPDLVALTSLTQTVPRAYEIAASLRAAGMPVVIGGVHATLLPDEVAQHADVVYQGEAEGSWQALIRDFEAGRLQPRYQGNVPSLAALPQPRREYGRRYRLDLVSASRGCRYRCEFCTLWKLESGHHRTRPPEEVVDEIGALDRTPGVNGHRPIFFTDENVFVEREWALGLFRTMAARGIRRPFAIQASLDIADDEEMLAVLQEGGCMTVLIGFESVSEESLRLMRKGVNLRIGIERYKDKIDRLHAHGLAASGTFMFGNDGDGPDIFERTVAFVLDSGLDLAHFGLLTPNPGTDLFNRLAREGRLLYTDFPRDYARYDLRTAVFQPLHMTCEELERGLMWATRAIGAGLVLARRARRTWQATHNPVMTALALAWNQSGLYRRVMGGR